jgi:hypothetical protein
MLRVLFIASNPAGQRPLRLEAEITELQLTFAQAQGEPANFAFLPEIGLEEFPAALLGFKPDILHISAHGANDRLVFAKSDGTQAELTSDLLTHYLSATGIPTLVYLNGCNSASIAEELSKTAPMTVGSTAEINNLAARSAAASFYRHILVGHSVQTAFDLANAVAKGVQGSQLELKLYSRIGIDPGGQILHKIPRLLADFKDGKPRLNGRNYKIVFGIAGCPKHTRQVVFFTDHPGAAEDYPDDLENQLCLVVRKDPENGNYWCELPNDYMWAERDVRYFGVGTDSDGASFTVSSTISEAIEAHYMSFKGKVPRKVADAISVLRNG